MSDLTATACGCNNGCNGSNLLGGNNSCSLLILLMLLSNCGNNSGCGNGLLGGNGNSCSDLIVWILLLNCLSGNCNN